MEKWWSLVIRVHTSILQKREKKVIYLETWLVQFILTVNWNFVSDGIDSAIAKNHNNRIKFNGTQL